MAENFAATDNSDGSSTLRWGDDPLNFWTVATCEIDEAKRLISSGEHEGQDGSTIPATVALCKKWLDGAEA